MSKLFLLKLIHDADGEFTVDDIGSVEGLELLFELQKQEFVVEEPTTKCWGVTDLGDWRLTLEDASASQLEDLATDEQRMKVEQMTGRLGWKVSHLWEYENDTYAVWMIAPNPAKEKGWVHSMILPDGEMRRVDTTLKGQLS